MPKIIRLGSLICILSLEILLCSCAAFYHYYPVTVQTIDAETKLPIKGADVVISYPLTTPYKAPFIASASTSDNGIAQVKAVTKGIYCALMEVSAKGYMKDDEDISLDQIEQNAEEAQAGKKPTFIKELYAEPRPQVTLILPDAALGPFKLKVIIQENFVYKAGQRDFQYPVEISEKGTITGPPLLNRIAPAGFSARYANGKELTSTAVDPDIGFWWLGKDNDLDVFFVGTPRACQQYKKDHAPRGGSDSGGSGKKGRRQH